MERRWSRCETRHLTESATRILVLKCDVLLREDSSHESDFFVNSRVIAASSHSFISARAKNILIGDTKIRLLH